MSQNVMILNLQFFLLYVFIIYHIIIFFYLLYTPYMYLFVQNNFRNCLFFGIFNNVLTFEKKMIVLLQNIIINIKKIKLWIYYNNSKIELLVVFLEVFLINFCFNDATTTRRIQSSGQSLFSTADRLFFYSTY